MSRSRLTNQRLISVVFLLFSKSPLLTYVFRWSLFRRLFRSLGTCRLAHWYAYVFSSVLPTRKEQMSNQLFFCLPEVHLRNLCAFLCFLFLLSLALVRLVFGLNTGRKRAHRFKINYKPQLAMLQCQNQAREMGIKISIAQANVDILDIFELIRENPLKLPVSMRRDSGPG